ncbi:MAG: AAA family ATPase [Planctomycetota bacterium]|nr:AAA family ATPase [Planctomycetota bacterium]
MSKVIHSIRFEHFRGLPDNDFNLKGKSLVLLGSNGKGKSAIVDGIEFVFSGQVSRFVGAGTGSIDHDDAIQHVKKLGVPKVTLSLNPPNGAISRSLDSEKLSVTDRQAVKDYLEHHPGVDAFILRRAKILNFVCDQDADRYRKFIQLLGVSHVDTLQRIFVEAERQAKDSAQRARNAYLTKLAVFRDPVTKFDPQNLAEILRGVSDAVAEFGLDKLAQWSDAEIRLHLLKAMRPEANKDKIDALTRALVSLENPLPPDIGSDIQTANALRQKLAALSVSSIDAPRSNIIAEAAGYLTKHAAETNCPLCEQEFSQRLADVLARLKQRGDALRELREAVASRKAAVSRAQRYGGLVATQISKDLEHAALLEPATKQTLRDARASALRWLRSVNRAEASSPGADLAAPRRLSTLAASRSDCAAIMKAQKTTLVPPDTSKLEAAVALVEKGIATHAEIATAEGAIGGANELALRATVAKDAFSKARESAIQKVFEAIAGTVLDYYRCLHDCDDDSERSECTAIELKPTSRAAAGGLRLAIQFLGLADSRDPRAFLSEGHLDSLGLCLFLATVRIFNPPGSLLVLDDVLTSIDREHRRRVGELLFREFADYQIVLTTHDEHWHDLLKSSAVAWGIQWKWLFVKVESWAVDSGPAFSEVGGSWEFIEGHLTEAEYRELGGPFRLILEDFIKRSAVKLEVKVRFKIDGKYTAGDFVTAGIQNTIRDTLVKLAPTEETTVRTEVGRVFGQGDLVNFLSHDNPGRLEVTFDQAKDFVQGLRDLTKRCEEHKLIKGR